MDVSDGVWASRLAALPGAESDGEPGVKTIWIGLQRVVDFASGVRFMRKSVGGSSYV